MTTRDGIGAPRQRDVVERDAQALELIKTRQAEGLCTRLADVKKILDPSLSRSQVFYVFKRLEAAGIIERRAGYLWCLREG
jgi:DNA-binding Lrp family transcriptional regulator